MDSVWTRKRYRGLGFALTVAGGLLSAPAHAVDSSPLKPGLTPKGEELMLSLLVVECVWPHFLSKDAGKTLAKARAGGLVKPFSQGWCIKNGYIPKELKKGGEKH